MDANDIVLVALLNKPRDLEIIRTEHWYRIPVRHAPAHLMQTRYVAFYLTKAFGERKWTIREYAPVRGHELVRRCDLFPEESDHPRARDAYYKLQLGTLIELPRPIVSRHGRRILFIWTTGDKFSRAVELNDLLGRSAADDALWDALKESGIRAERQIVVRDKRARYRVDFWIPCQRGRLAVIISDVPRRLPKANLCQTLCFDTREIDANASDCARQIAKMARELGGTKYTME